MQNIIYEYEEVKNSDLKDHIINTSELHKYFKLEWKTLKARQYCGILNFNGIDFYLLPKIAKGNNDDQNLNIFIYMLKYVYNIKLENENIGSSQNIKTKNLLEMFIQLFAHTLLIELKKGIYKEYITEQDNLTTLKGKYLINENIKHNFTKNKIYCEFDEFSANNSLNQFFLYTIKYLQKFVKEKKLLKQCELIFDEVENLTIDINKLNIHFNRLNQRFKTSYEVALLLLQRSIPLFSQGKKSFAFLFDMNILFEKFIAKVVKSIDLKAKIQNKDSFGDLVLKPDIILDNLIIDTKYKKLKSIDDIKQSDKLQAFAYGINYNVDNVILLYPKHLDEVDENLLLGGKNKQVNLKITCIDLSFDGKYNEYIEKIKNRLEII
jgi:5-methylcytosine-specific restriction enzyme subunit McrC